MSHRILTIDPAVIRKREYDAMQTEQMEAIMEAFALLKQQGHDVGSKMDAVLTKRDTIKRKAPKL
jgi:hypothetical protein